MKEITKWISNLNAQQKLIIAIALPIILFFITLKIAGKVGEDFVFGERPFAFNQTWWVWLLFAVLITYCEYKLFEKSGK